MLARLKEIFALGGSLLTRLHIETGQTMAEYGILIAAVALIVVVAAVTLGGSISHIFSATATKV
jgi:Flp pilus assembly pilin Flp